MIYPSTGSSPAYVDVSFPDELFTSADKIIPFAIASSAAPGTRIQEVCCRKEDITLNGMRVYATRTDTTSFGVFWMAIQHED